MTTNIGHLNEPDKDEGDYFPFIALAGDLRAFDIAAADYWCGRHEARLDEMVFRTPDGRWVLVYAPTPGHENCERHQPVHRELTPGEAARWFQINRRTLPEGLVPVVPGSKAQAGEKPTRLDRDWTPPTRSRAESTAPGSTDPATPPNPPEQQLDLAKARNKKDEILTLFRKHPNLLNAQIARRVGCHRGYVSKALGEIRKAMGESDRQDAIRRHHQKGGPTVGRRGDAPRSDRRREREEEEPWDDEADDD